MMVCGTCLRKSVVLIVDRRFEIGITCGKILCSVGGSLKRLKQVEEKLWHGQVDEAIAYFDNCRRKQAHNFCAYLAKHRHRLVNYRYFQEQRFSSIGSGAVESAVKQIDRRLKISGAQWKLENVSNILQLRCVYLNGLLTV